MYDATSKRVNGFYWEAHSCDDGRAQTAPAGSYHANDFGLHDMLGNVWEWVTDCWNGNYGGAPTDSSAWTSGECGRRVLRGGSWFSAPWSLRAAGRVRDGIGDRYYFFGFRLARTGS